MNKALIFTLGVCLLLVGTTRSIRAQDEVSLRTSSIAAWSNNKNHEVINGPVRRVRVETVQILVKDGNFVEGPRVLREIATYDPKGTKIDSVSYPQGGRTLPGKKQYRYDDKGNVVEMVLRSDDGSVLGKETYKYEFDELENWKKMTSSIAVYENGVVRYEPIEIIYRTITYYYGQAVEKLASAALTPSAGPTLTTPVSIPSANRVLTTTTSGTTSAEQVRDEISSRSVDSAMKDSATENSAPTKQEDLSVVGDEVALNTKAVRTTTSKNSAAVKRVSEKKLRAAALNLPTPEYPQAAWDARARGKVQVQIVVDEKGEVGSARAISGNRLLRDAAERAAENARFLPTKLSADSTKVFGLISYDFVVPAPTASLVPASTTTLVPASTSSSEVSTSRPPVENKNAEPDENPSSPISSAPPPTVSLAAETANSLEPAAPSLYKEGLRYLAAGRHAEAVEALKQSVQLNPNDASAYVKLGMAHSALGQYKETVVALKTAIRIRREAVDALGYYYLGHAYVALDKPSYALEAFKQALYNMRAEAADITREKVPTLLSLEVLHYNLGLAYHNVERYYDAIKELKEVVKLNPKATEAYYGLALAYLAVGDTKSAQKQEAPLRSLNPKLADKVTDAIAVGLRRSVAPLCRNITCR